MKRQTMMHADNKPSLKEPEILFLSLFGIGFIPKAPGTWGTLATLPLLYLLGLFNAPFFIFIPFIISATIISCFITHITEKKYNIHDPSWIVVDEALGIATAWLFLQSQNISHLILIFVLFRFFDIVKVWPASYIDKELKHSSSTIIDDLISGLYSGLVYILILQSGIWKF